MMNTRDFEPMGINPSKLTAIETWAEQGLLTANQVQYIMNVCGEIIRDMWRDQGDGANRHMSKADKEDRLLRSIATLDRLHEAVKLNSRRVNEGVR